MGEFWSQNLSFIPSKKEHVDITTNVYESGQPDLSKTLSTSDLSIAFTFKSDE